MKMSTEILSDTYTAQEVILNNIVCQGKTERLSFAVGGIPYTLLLEDIPDENEY